MRPVRLLVAVYVMLPLGCGGSARVSKRPDAQVVKGLAGATRAEVFRVFAEGGPVQEKPKQLGSLSICGFPVIAQGKDQGKEFGTKLADILTDKSTYSEESAGCFWPGVAFRAWNGEKEIDVLICFYCSNLYCGPPVASTFENASFVGSRSRVRLVRLVKEAFADDKESQELKEE